MTNTAVEVWVSDPDTHDDNNVAHIVRKNVLNEGYIGQQEIEALCGFKWVPHKNPDNLPVCHKCYAILNRHKKREEN